MTLADTVRSLDAATSDVVKPDSRSQHQMSQRELPLMPINPAVGPSSGIFQDVCDYATSRLAAGQYVELWYFTRAGVDYARAQTSDTSALPSAANDSSSAGATWNVSCGCAARA